MPKQQDRQETDGESLERPMGDGVPHGGVDEQAARRAHMREQTTARQAAERKARETPYKPGLDRAARAEEKQRRATDLRDELARINSDHQIWLGGDRPADRPEGGDDAPQADEPGA